MTDRELLELAAKAAGYQFSTSMRSLSRPPVPVILAESGRWKQWNPLHDDGDALRLAVKLNIHISLYGPDTGITAWIVKDSANHFDADYGDDPCASTRRSIVRASAEIGRQMG